MKIVANRMERLAAVVTLAREVNRKGFGRTALMKCAYFLQTLKDVPLGYRFSLYTYGPYDADVLQDIDYAKRLGALDVDLVSYPTGYGYSITPGDGADAVQSRAKKFLSKYESEIKAVASEFGGKSAVDLELDSAIIYVSRSTEFQGAGSHLKDIAQHVRAIKPRFSENEIRDAARVLESKGYVAL